VSDDNLVR